MRFVIFTHSLISDWNHGNAHFLRGVATELGSQGHDVRIFEPRDGWSLRNLTAAHGDAPLADFETAYPLIRSRFYDLDTLDLDAALEGADVVLVHEWNPHALIQRIGEHRARHRYRLFFHDTHHRSVTAPDAMAAYDLRHYDGVLAYGAVIAEIYRRNGWVRNAWVWHEAADTRVFYPRHPELAAPAASAAHPAPAAHLPTQSAHLPTQSAHLPTQPAHPSPQNRDRKGADGPHYLGDLVWIGNWGDGERTDELREFLIGPVEALGLKARVYGVRYPQEARDELESAGIDYAGWIPNYRVPEVFAQFRVTVHIPRRPYAQALPGIPTIRPFEAMACGIPLISAPWDDSEGLFRPGRDFLFARNAQEMIDQLREVLSDEARARRLAESGLETIRARHTCAHRAAELLSIVGQFRAEAA